MRVAIPYRTVQAFYEKMGVLFGELDVVGFVSDGCAVPGKDVDCDRGFFERLRGHGVEVRLHEVPYECVDWSLFDAVIDPWEARVYTPRWRAFAPTVDLPRVVRPLWSTVEGAKLTGADLRMLRRSVVRCEAQSWADGWRRACPRSECLLYYPGPWPFERPWVGKRGVLLYVLNGIRQWRGAHGPGYDRWADVCRMMPPGTTHHQDASEHYLDEPEFAELLRWARCACNLDRPGARPFSTVMLEAMCCGTPCLCVAHPGSEYARRFAQVDPMLACASERELADVATKIIFDRPLAEALSARTAELARGWWSREAMLAGWGSALEEAVDVHGRR